MNEPIKDVIDDLLKSATQVTQFDIEPNVKPYKGQYPFKVHIPLKRANIYGRPNLSKPVTKSDEWYDFIKDMEWFYYGNKFKDLIQKYNISRKFLRQVKNQYEVNFKNREDFLSFLTRYIDLQNAFVDQSGLIPDTVKFKYYNKILRNSKTTAYHKVLPALKVFLPIEPEEKFQQVLEEQKDIKKNFLKIVSTPTKHPKGFLYKTTIQSKYGYLIDPDMKPAFYGGIIQLHQMLTSIDTLQVEMSTQASNYIEVVKGLMSEYEHYKNLDILGTRQSMGGFKIEVLYNDLSDIMMLSLFIGDYIKSIKTTKYLQDEE